VAAVRGGAMSVRNVLEKFPRMMAEEPGRSPKVMQSIIVALLTSQPVREVFLGKAVRGRKLLAELFAWGQKRGEIRRDVPAQDLARSVQQAYFGAMLLWSLDETGQLARRFEESARVMWPGLRAAGKR